MKTYIVTVTLALIASVIFAGACWCAYAVNQTAHVTSASPTVEVETGFTVSEPTGTVTNRPVLARAVAKVARAKSPSKHLVCGRVTENLVGGSNSICEWQ